MNLPKRGRRWLVGAVVFLIVYALVGFFVLPPIVRSQAEKRLAAELGRKVSIGKIRINPFALSVTIEQFDIRLKTDDGSFLGWERLYVNFEALASLTGDWVLGEVELDGAHLGVVILKDGTLNFSDLIARLAPPAPVPAVPPPPAKTMRPVRIGSLKVNSARLEFADQSRGQPFATVLGPVSVAVTEFRTEGKRGAPYHFEAVTEAGEKLTWSGTLVANPFHSEGELSLENILLPKYAPYYSTYSQTDVSDGKLSMRGRYEIDLTAGQRVLKLAGGAVQLRGLKLVERANHEAAFELPSLDVTGINADALTLKASVASVVLAGGHVQVRRDANGAINLLAMLQPPGPAAPVSAAPATPAATPAAPAKLPDVTVGEVTLRDFQVNLTDQALPRPAQLSLGGIQFSAKKLSLADGAVMPVDLSLTWAPQGTVHVGGSFTLKPAITADLKVDVASLAILPVSPYIEQFVNARLTQGAVTTSTTVHAEVGAGAPAVSLAGDVSVQQLDLVDSTHNEPLAGFGSLTLSGLKVSTAPQLALSLDEVAIAAPYARVLVNADKSVNLAGLAKAPASAPAAAEAASAPAPAPTPASEAPRPKITIGKVAISSGDFSFNDRSIEPNVRMAIGQFGGTVTGLSSENVARADVDLKGTVDGVGPVAITGKLDPLGVPRFVDLKVDFKNVDLLPISPYTGKFAGYELARGKLVVDTKVHVEGDRLDTTNVVTLNQFTFGAATNSPDATGLPVRLGVALLKDLDGKIVIDLPVQGTLGDPNFRIGKVVMRVIVNLLTKAATSPFALLGSMFGGGGDELAFQEFSPGGSDLLPTELPKLETMVKALTNRPGLSLALEGGFDAAADSYALKRAKLTDLVRRQIWAARHAADANTPPPAQLVITPEEQAAMVKTLFDAKFPPGTEFGAPLAGPPPVTAAPPPPKVGLFKRVIKVITFQGGGGTKPAAPTPAAAPATATPGIPLEEMTGRLTETMTVTDDDLRAIATARAERVRDYFITTGHIAADRLFLAQGKEAAKQNKGPRVFLSLQ